MSGNGKDRMKDLGIPAELQAHAKAISQQCLMGLQVLYPIEVAADKTRAVTAASMAATDMFQICGPMFEAMTKKKHEYEDASLTIVKPSSLVGGEDEQCGHYAHLDIGQAETLDDVLKATALHALLSSPTTRAILYWHGYRISFGLREKTDA
jgi:hypothetical protein